MTHIGNYYKLYSEILDDISGYAGASTKCLYDVRTLNFEALDSLEDDDGEEFAESIVEHKIGIKIEVM